MPAPRRVDRGDLLTLRAVPKLGHHQPSRHATALGFLSRSLFLSVRVASTPTLPIDRGYFGRGNGLAKTCVKYGLPDLLVAMPTPMCV